MGERPEKQRVSAAEVRQWALRSGHPVGSRGHLPLGVIRLYNRFHGRHNKVFVSTNPWEKK